MRLQHTTTSGTLTSILLKGLLRSRSKGKLKVVWFHVPSLAPWGFLHVVRRHGGDVRRVVSVECDVPRSWLRKAPRKGLYYCVCDVPPARIRSIKTWGQISE